MILGQVSSFQGHTTIAPFSDGFGAASSAVGLVRVPAGCCQDIVSRAESLTLTYRYEKGLRLSEEGYIVDGAGRPLLDEPLFKMSDHDGSSGELSLSAALGREVNTSRSGMHTPLEVYEGCEYRPPPRRSAAPAVRPGLARLARPPPLSVPCLRYFHRLRGRCGPLLPLPAVISQT